MLLCIHTLGHSSLVNLLRLKLLVKLGKLTEAFEMFGAQLTLLVCLFIYTDSVNKHKLPEGV